MPTKTPTKKGTATRESILLAATDLASVEGLEGLTIGQLAEKLGMSKAGLFAHFGSKEGLQLATLEAAQVIFMREVGVPAQQAKPGLKRLEALLEAWLSYMERGVFSGGCFFAAASAELDGRPGPVRERLCGAVNAGLMTLNEQVRLAQENGELEPTVEPAQLVFELHAFLQNANATHQLLQDPAIFDRARTATRERLARERTKRR